ncbi:uncharacterized protein EDB93DRAFT_1041834, partial [Suillus bovinus]|uniref:uncharacterized protein n=1 Tax=Suillus bovinus TaxID=48563 RepID=UPI001B880C42
IIYGRFHIECSHFIVMSMRFQDYLQPNCLFSSSHVHPIACRSHKCIRSMDLPFRNPIHLSPSKCGDCVFR